MDFIALTTEEAIEACIEYAGEDCTFSLEQREFRYTGKGWGSPRAIYKALHDPLPKAGEATPRIQNHAYLGKPYRFKLQQFREALASGALLVDGLALPRKQVKHVRLDPVEAAHMEYDVKSNSAQIGNQKYADLKFYPEAMTPERMRSGAGRAAKNGRIRVKALHEENKHRITAGMTQTAYARILEAAARRSRYNMDGLSKKSIQRHLEYHGVLTKRSRQKQ